MLRTQFRLSWCPARSLCKSQYRQASEYDPRKLQQIIDASNMGSLSRADSGPRATEPTTQPSKRPASLKGDSGTKPRPTPPHTETSSVSAAGSANAPAATDRKSSGRISLSDRIPLSDRTSVSDRKSFSDRISDRISDHISGGRNSTASAAGALDLNARWATFSHKVAEYYASFNSVSQLINDITGYSAIEQQKARVTAIELEIVGARNAVKAAKRNYEEAIRKWSDSQKEINELLTRKHNWSPQDVERFTELYKNDHQYQHDESSCKAALEAAEQNVDAVQLKLTSSILTRYHEEQLWSDKIRQASTWGTWMLMGVNILLFATATLVVEPWKRRNLVAAFQAEVSEKMEQQAAEIQRLAQKLEPARPPLAERFTPASLVFVDSWAALKAWLWSLPRLLRSDRIVVDRPDFAVLSAAVFVAGWLAGAVGRRLL